MAAVLAGLRLAHFRDQKIAASFKRRSIQLSGPRTETFPRSKDRGLIQACSTVIWSTPSISLFPRSKDRGLIQACNRGRWFSPIRRISAIKRSRPHSSYSLQSVFPLNFHFRDQKIAASFKLRFRYVIYLSRPISAIKRSRPHSSLSRNGGRMIRYRISAIKRSRPHSSSTFSHSSRAASRISAIKRSRPHSSHTETKRSKYSRFRKQYFMQSLKNPLGLEAFVKTLLQCQTDR